MIRTAVAVCAFVIGLGSLTACEEESSGDAAPSRLKARPVVLIDDGRGTGTRVKYMMQVYGTLAIIGDRCVGFIQPGAGPRDRLDAVAIFPVGTTVTGPPDDPIIRTGSRDFQLGDKVAFGLEGTMAPKRLLRGCPHALFVFDVEPVYRER